MVIEPAFDRLRDAGTPHRHLGHRSQRVADPQGESLRGERVASDAGVANRMRAFSPLLRPLQGGSSRAAALDTVGIEAGDDRWGERTDFVDNFASMTAQQPTVTDDTERRMQAVAESVGIAFWPSRDGEPVKFVAADGGIREGPADDGSFRA